MSGAACRSLAWILVLVSLALALPAQAAKRVDPAQQKELQQLLSVLDQLVMKGPANNPVGETYRTVRTQMQAARVMFAVDADSPSQGLLKSASFSPNRNGVSWISVDPLLLKTAKTQPSLALTLLMNAMVMADGFFADPAGFARLVEDPLEAFLFSMDGLYIQALFVRDFIKPSYPSIAPFEQFLLDSLEYENMATAALFILGVDQNIVYGLRAKESEIRAKNLSLEAYCKQVDGLLAEIDKGLDKALELQKAPAANATADDLELRDRTRYIAVISGLTMLKYGAQLMERHLPLFDPKQADARRGYVDATNKSFEALAGKLKNLGSTAMAYRTRQLERLGL